MIGMRLIPLLRAGGHQVAGMTRSPQNADEIRELGAPPVICDVFDAEGLTDLSSRAGAWCFGTGSSTGPDTNYQQEPPPPRVPVGEAARHTVEALGASSGVLEIVEE